MAKADFLNVMYSKNKTPLEFHFDNLMANPLLSYISVYDIGMLNKIAMDNKLASKPKEKYRMIDEIMRPRGFRKFASGTNRVIYRCLDDPSIILKIAYDSVGMRDNPCEYKNQLYLKPFVTKCFEVSPCGTVGLYERVEPIISKDEFISIAEDVFDMLNKHIIGVYVLEDVGTKYFMNYGIRRGFGPVLLDFPYMYKLDGNKLYCNAEDLKNPSRFCEGSIDYDIGFNNLVCEKCGKHYLATELKKYEQEKTIIVKEEGDVGHMKFKITEGSSVLISVNTDQTATEYIQKPIAVVQRKQKSYNNRNKYGSNDNNNYKRGCVVKVIGEGKSLNPVISTDRMKQNTSVDNVPKLESVYHQKTNNGLSVKDIMDKIKVRTEETVPIIVKNPINIIGREDAEVNNNTFLDEQGNIRDVFTSTNKEEVNTNANSVSDEDISNEY